VSLRFPVSLNDPLGYVALEASAGIAKLRLRQFVAIPRRITQSNALALEPVPAKSCGDLILRRKRKRRSLPPTFECAATEWMQSRTSLVRPNTVRMARVALNRLLPVFGPRLLSDIDARSIQEYQQRRLVHGAQGRTIDIETGVLRQILKANECWQPIEGRMRTLRERKDIGRALLPDEERRLVVAAQSLDSACCTAVLLALNTAMLTMKFAACDGGRLTSRCVPSR
jgi:hypothetical protein